MLVNFLRKILIMIVFINVTNVATNINQYINTYTDIIIDIYPSSYGSPSSSGTYHFKISADGELTVSKSKINESVDLEQNDFDNIINILNEIEENSELLDYKVIFDSWDMQIYYNHQTYRLNCWHDIYSEELIELLTDISPINIELYDFS